MIKKITLFFAVIFLASCIIKQHEYYDYTYPDDYDESMYGAVQEDNAVLTDDLKRRGRIVNGSFRPFRSTAPKVRHSYHFAKDSSPSRHKDRDADWAREQSPNHYTIEVGSGENAANVAKLLHISPRSKRKAQIKLKDSDSYTGLIGSYQSRDEAEAALNALPGDLRDKARINQWHRIQPKLSKPPANHS